MKRFVFAFLFLLITAATSAQRIQDFTLPDAVTGKNVSLTDFAAAPVVMVIFTSNTCPYDNYYTGRINDLATQFNSKIPVLLINSGIDDTESLARMKDFSVQNKFTIPYLADKNQQVLTMFNPRKSPEAFLLQKTNGQFSIVYRGAIDDNPQSAGEAKNTYLKDAALKLLAGEKIDVTDIRPVGCSIRKMN